MRQKKYPCGEAREVMAFSLKMAILLALCQILILAFGDITSHGTYFRFQTVIGMTEIIQSVLLLGGVGSVWLQHLHGRNR